MTQVLYKGRKRAVHVGKSGGRYVIVQGAKKYIRSKTGAVKKKPTTKKKVVKKKPATKKKVVKKMKGGDASNDLVTQMILIIQQMRRKKESEEKIKTQMNKFIRNRKDITKNIVNNAYTACENEI
jgi:membrane-associated HD superfamily phosphohydrolase